MTTEKLKRIVAFYLVINLVFQVVSPTAAYALTSGPGQPEMASFEPVGTTDMVDVFSGDFNYNIPLLTVPGPNGGYPINIAYHAGIGMEDEASWVGLGWNINPGVISRQMRGLPDDFSGETVTKNLNLRPNHTVSTNFQFPSSVKEIVGFNLGLSGGIGVTYNNYRGFGQNASVGFSFSKNGSAGSSLQKGGNASFSFNSLSGETDLNAGLSLTSKKNDAENKFSLNVSFGSSRGLKDINFSYDRYKNRKEKWDEVDEFLAEDDESPQEYGKQHVTHGGVSFASSAFVTPTDMPQKGFNISTSFSFGTVNAGVYNPFTVSASYDKVSYPQQTLQFASYGYLHSKERTANMNDNDNQDDYQLMDFNREHEGSPSKDMPSLPASIANYDIYSATGQGVGGVFRPMCNDIGLYVDPEIRGEVKGGSIGVELGAGSGFWNVGADLALNYTQNYSGPWHNNDYWYEIKNRTHKSTNDMPPYFMLAGESVANENEETLGGSYGAFPIVKVVHMPEKFSSSDFSPLVDVRVNNGGVITQENLTTKKTRSQLMSYKTFGEIGGITDYQKKWVNNHVYNLNSNPLVSPSLTNGSQLGNQIGEFSVTNPDGNKYIYALPAINKKQKEVSFSIKKDDGPTRTSPDGKIINYSYGIDNSINNEQLDDHFFSSTELPSYVHSYMLTAIVSPDYIDLKGDGLTTDDFGYWVKFNYSKTSNNYKWRSPLSGANFLKGHLSTNNDDKAGYIYGEKEIWYLNSIETKSHIALFKMGNRSDGKAPKSEDEPYTGIQDNIILSSANEILKLEKISLYSKISYDQNFPPQPLKEVNFGYDYTLCPNVLNKYSNIGEGSGKLTLKTINFSYLGNAKGALSPYKFDYKLTDLSDNDPLQIEANPAYSTLHEDRWGNYKPDLMEGVNSNIFPYAIQRSDYDNNGATNSIDELKRNSNASAWSLRQITLPSGGKIKVDYEADDYAYVHNEKASEMLLIEGFAHHEGNGPQTDGMLSPIESKMKDDNLFLLFTLNDNNINDIKKYTNGLDEIYFKAYINLKKNGIQGVMQQDYVCGYAELAKDNNGNNISGFLDSNTGYIKLKKVPVHDYVSGAPYTHPFRKAAWQYLKLERPDLLYPSSNNSISNGGSGLQFVSQVVNSIVTALPSMSQLLIGYYNFCEAAGYGKTLNAELPSFIRLNTPDGIKYGGGHRVKKIVITDTWQQTGSEIESQYGQEYSYRLPDGTSSGVASYEPLIGGEEITQHKPIRYSSPYFIFKNENLYIEEPVGEGFYPGASVGYSRVLVKNINQKDQSNNEITKTKEGITIHEFYTYKDFPYKINRSRLEHEKFSPKITIPFIGSVSFENHGFSQAMNVSTYDMHGRQKSVATYPANINVNNANNVPVSKVEYIYNSDGTGLNALFGDAFFKTSSFGKTTDRYVDMQDTYGVTLNAGLQVNVYGFGFVPALSIMPIINYSESVNKTIVSMTVDHHTAMLIETRAFNEGSTVTTKNIMFDAYTGKPLLTSVTNDFDKPIYKYEYAAHWAYDKMGGAYKNDRNQVSFTTNANGSINQTANLVAGDEISFSGSIFWVIDKDGVLTLMNEQGDFVGNSTVNGMIIKSGRRNQQSISNGSIISLTNPVSARQFQLFEDYNNNINNNGFWQSEDCSTHLKTEYRKELSASSSNPFVIKIIRGQSSCTLKVSFPNPPSTINWQTIKLKKAGNKAYALDPNNNNILATGDIEDGCGLSECLDGVLNASSAEFKDEGWVFDYPDVGDPDVKINSTTSKISDVVGNDYNKYRIGTAGIWRMHKSYAYQAARNQNTNTANLNTTKIQNDGTFEKFTLFNWNKSIETLNPEWTNVNEVTKYSPYGFELENVNAIGIKTSALYGYNNSVQTAISNNASYYETAFDGFEEYDLNTAYDNLSSPLMRQGGHIKLISSSGHIKFNSENSHTGKKSLLASSAQIFNLTPLPFSTSNFYFQVLPTKKYIVSAWFKATSGIPDISVSGVQSSEIFSDDIKIEGWQKVDLAFTTGATVSSINLQFKVNGATEAWYFDDIRLQPFNSTMKTFVYEPKTLWLMAELDNQNYATLYNYDEEGTLTQVKKETVNGIQTLKTTRSNIKRNP